MGMRSFLWLEEIEKDVSCFETGVFFAPLFCIIWCNTVFLIYLHDPALGLPETKKLLFD